MSVLMKLDGFHRTLIHAGPAFDTIFWVDRIGFIFLDLINLTRADLSTVPTAIAFILVNHRIHRHCKSQIPNPKSQTNHKLQYPMTKIRFEEKAFSRYALCAMPLLTHLFCSTG